MPTVYLDFETRSVVDLKKVGLVNYAQHPTTGVICMAYAVDDGPVELWRPGDPMPDWVCLTGDCGMRVVAHNAAFEREIWRNVVEPRYGWGSISDRAWDCTMTRAYAMGLPGSLDGAAKALCLPVEKDAAGHALMLRMCRPRRMDGDTPVWWEDEDRLERLYAYCKRDVEVERELDRKLFPLSQYERRVWLADQTINRRGVAIDIPSARAAEKAIVAARKDLDKSMAKLTGGRVATCSALGELKVWLQGYGLSAEDGGTVDLAKADIAALLEQRLPDQARAALLLRQEAAKASTAKLNTMLSLANGDGRVRYSTQYHGAGTGRWAGRGIQPHNLPRNVPKPTVVAEWLREMREGRWRLIDMRDAPIMEAVSRALRGFIVPAEGSVLVAGDFSAVESRGTAWFCGEDWKIRAYEQADARTGPGLYELIYARSFNVPVESVLNPSWERQIGKVMDLAFSYQGGVGAFHSMARTYGLKVTDVQADLFKRQWREAHPATVQSWYDLQRAAIAAVRNKGDVFAAGAAGRQVKFKVVGSFLWCLLPSGRTLCYPYPKLLDGIRGPQLTYMTVPSANDRQRGRIIDDPANTTQWARIGTYGGSLLENIIQAICRDLLADCILRVEEYGFPVVLHVHDELVAEVPRARAKEAAAIISMLMSTAADWAVGFPLKTVAVEMERYGKP